MEENDWKDDKYCNEKDDCNIEKYESDWLNNTKEGKGILVLNDGDKYDSEFKNNYLYCERIYYLIKDDIHKGIYRITKEMEKGKWNIPMEINILMIGK